MTPESVIYTRKLINETTERNFIFSILIHGSGGSRHSVGGKTDPEIRGKGDSKNFFLGPLGLSLV